MGYPTRQDQSEIVAARARPLAIIGCIGRVDIDLAAIGTTVENTSSLSHEELQQARGVPLRAA